MNRIQEEFRPSVTEALESCLRHFGPFLTAAYLSGSVALGEALPGLSDVDFFVFLDRRLEDCDHYWAGVLAKDLGRKHPAVGKFEVNLNETSRLRNEPTWRFVLRYNSIRLCGRDLVAEMDREGIDTPAPGGPLAVSRLGWMRSLAEAAAAGRCAEVDFHLPDDACLAARKIAQRFVLLEGAHVLMADDGFISFRREDVMAQLERLYPEWKSFLLKTRALCNDPCAAGVDLNEFTREAVEFLRWGISRIEAKKKLTG